MILKTATTPDAENKRGRIFQLNVSQGGVPKLAVREAILTPEGLTTDKQKLTKFHGGVERAVCLYSLEHILALQREGHPIFAGSTGENVTIAGLDWARLTIDTRLALGDEVIIEISSYAAPCKQIAASFMDGNSNRISNKQHPGWARLYARVLRGGKLCVGQRVQVVSAYIPDEAARA